MLHGHSQIWRVGGDWEVSLRVLLHSPFENKIKRLSEVSQYLNGPKCFQIVKTVALSAGFGLAPYYWASPGPSSYFYAPLRNSWPRSCVNQKSNNSEKIGFVFLHCKCTPFTNRAVQETAHSEPKMNHTEQRTNHSVQRTNRSVQKRTICEKTNLTVKEQYRTVQETSRSNLFAINDDWLSKIILQIMGNISILAHNSKSMKSPTCLNGHPSIKCFVKYYIENNPVFPKKKIKLQKRIYKDNECSWYLEFPWYNNKEETRVSLFCIRIEE